MKRGRQELTVRPKHVQCIEETGEPEETPEDYINDDLYNNSRVPSLVKS